ncbi:hypothetical protein DY000_02036707 [Brassica cretica]|uniref:FCP1 homology domain-containing protein n=1 Tax=Brassica cretica TaxID=69181 RepID=A0ABQ7BHV0_BRACR|nr:hypothetical protein DY000_02036707 [Brassica cretica]
MSTSSSGYETGASLTFALLLLFLSSYDGMNGYGTALVMKTSYFKKGIHPLPGAHTTLHKLSRYCELSVVTSRQNAIKDHTLEWLDMHFPGLFKHIHFGNHFALHGESKPKSEICRSFGAEILIDDNPRYAEECANIGMKVLLFDYDNSYPWSKTESVDRHPLVTRVHNWEEVEQQILSWVVTKC